MSTVTFSIQDPKRHLAQQIRDAEGLAESHTTKYKKHWQLARAAGLREALEVIDLAERCQAAGGSVENRSSDDILEEVER